MVRGESEEAPPEAEPVFDAGRRSGGRSLSGLPVEVAFEELQAPEVPRRRWSDNQPDEPAPPRLDFQRAQPAVPAYLIDDPAADALAELPPGGPQFRGRPSEPVGPPERRRVRAARLPDPDRGAG